LISLHEASLVRSHPAGESHSSVSTAQPAAVKSHADNPGSAAAALVIAEGERTLRAGLSPH